MKHNIITSAEKELFPCAFLFFFKETNDEEMNYKSTTDLIYNVL